MEVTIEQRESGVVLAIPHGDLDHQTAPSLREKVEAQIEQGTRKVIIDCSKLSYISSYGLTVMVSLHKKLDQVQGQLKLCRTQGGVAEVLNITGLKRLFDIYPSVATAEEAFNTPADEEE